MHIIAFGEAIGFLPALDKSSKPITAIGTATTARGSGINLSEADLAPVLPDRKPVSEIYPAPARLETAGALGDSGRSEQHGGSAPRRRIESHHFRRRYIC
jgi:hypothetical protein